LTRDGDDYRIEIEGRKPILFAFYPEIQYNKNAWKMQTRGKDTRAHG
jgi:hypothetical protein